MRPAHSVMSAMYTTFTTVAQQEKCRRILKHGLKLYDIRSYSHNVRMTSCLRSLPDARKVAYASRKQKSHRLNRHKLFKSKWCQASSSCLHYHCRHDQA